MNFIIDVEEKSNYVTSKNSLMFNTIGLLHNYNNDINASLLDLKCLPVHKGKIISCILQFIFHSHSMLIRNHELRNRKYQ